MLIFPAVISPTVATISVLIPFILVPAALITFVVWMIRKINRIDEKLMDIQEKLKDR
ncbi:hypothetical protein Desdi_0712 [Desulfitobacterium dichloroeliminans LMG P-21439]|uniref:Uncharacterized protein n=1 Tax=Desulfitobacterium dichloroeliminans (strain LMG P-21439 / DCA1) TaxID=871963 RepID=L0F313_DESDL|nr:hypothetical protein [Desulfitobacterium dichloroeliminans]AGA68239.1 hypothetical protein Desdi_0712 [Desulfitobacterium dichloroeliminans LMG P-21439]